MKNEIIPIMAAVMWGLCVFALPAQAQYGGGCGTADDPYLIYTAEHLNAIGTNPGDLDRHFKLMADIDLSSFTGNSFHIIGNIVKTFGGVFDGNNHTISNFSYTYTDRSYTGLFGYVRGQIKDLGLINPNVDVGTGNRVGLLVGYLSNGTITNCYVEGGSVAGGDDVGGLVGTNEGTITNCHAEGGSVAGRSVGGLVGVNSGTITNCYSSGSVAGNRYVGGLVGENIYGAISNCYSTGSVAGNRYVGGLVGWNIYGAITNCYSTGSVSGTGWSVSGLVGENYEGMAYNSFWDIETSGQSTSAGGKGKTTAEMQMASTFIGWGGCGNEGIWTLDEGNDYPHLWWEEKPGDPLPTYQLSDFITGSGTKTDPYLIYTGDELNMIGLFQCEWNKHFKLMSDVDLGSYTGTAFNIIGNYENPFTGVFDGNGHTISNFTYTSTGTNYIGLFGYVDDPNAEIKDLGLIDPNVNVDAGWGMCVGSLVGRLYNGTITDCYAQGSSVSGNESVAGLVGINEYGTITNCYSTCSISGDYRVGGLVGYNHGTITNCYSTGSISGCGYYGGPGQAWSSCIGGLVGDNEDGTITNSYATASVSGSGGVGGLVGENDEGMAYNSFWDIETSGQSTSAGGKGKTTAEMQMASTFIGWGGCGNEGIWTLDEGNDYPHLWWEEKPGDPLPTYQLSDLITGSGTKTDPYLIYTGDELNMIGLFQCEWNKYFRLMADIDLAGYTKDRFNVIGISENPFTGVFNGNGHKVSNVACDYYSGMHIGLFGYVNGGEIVNLGLIDPDVAGWDTAGSLVGYMRYGTIVNCYAEGGSVSGSYPVGGLCGRNYRGTITNCYAAGSVSGGDYVGGLCGFNGGTVSNCYATGSVTGEDYSDYLGGLCGDNSGTISQSSAAGSVSGGDDYVGGLCGFNGGTVSNCYATGSVTSEDYSDYLGGLAGTNSGTISNCYATGSVTGEDYSDYLGGLCGYNKSGTISNCYATGQVTGYVCVGGLCGRNYKGTISNCYAAGLVSGGDYVGGLMGYNKYGSISDSFWDIETSWRTTSAGGTGLPTAEMQMQLTFTDAGWDFVGETVNGIENIWFIPQQDYPRLWWEGMQVPMKLTPRTLNCRSEGNWVKAHLTLPEGFTVADVDSDRPAVLHSFGFESAPLYVFVNKNKLVQIEAAFEREEVCSLAGNWPQDLTVAGFLADGNIFLGTSTVGIIHPGLKVIEELASCWLQGDCVHPTWCDGIDMNRDSLVNLLDYALFLNSQVEFVTDE